MKTKTFLQYEVPTMKILIDIRETGAAYSRNLLKKGDAGKIRFRINVSDA